MLVEQAVRRLFPRDDGDRRDPSGDHAISCRNSCRPTYAYTATLGGPRAVARRASSRCVAMFVGRPAVEPRAAQIPDRHRRFAISALSMYMLTSYRPSDASQSSWYFAKVRMLIGAGLPLDLHFDHRRLLRWPQTQPDGHGVGAAQRRAQYRRLHRHLHRLQRARASPAISPEPPCRGARSPPRTPIRATTFNQLLHYFRHPGRLPAGRSEGAGHWPGSARTSRKQSSLLAYIDVFWVMTLLALGAIPLALLLLKTVKLGKSAPAGH